MRTYAGQGFIVLTMHWFLPFRELPQSQDIESHPVVIEMGRMTSKLLSVVHNLQTLDVEGVKLPYEVYTRLYQLRRLKKVIADGVTVVHSAEVEELDVTKMPPAQTFRGNLRSWDGVRWAGSSCAVLRGIRTEPELPRDLQSRAEPSFHLQILRDPPHRFHKSNKKVFGMGNSGGSFV